MPDRISDVKGVILAFAAALSAGVSVSPPGAADERPAARLSSEISDLVRAHREAWNEPVGELARKYQSEAPGLYNLMTEEVGSFPRHQARYLGHLRALRNEENAGHIIESLGAFEGPGKVDIALTLAYALRQAGARAIAKRPGPRRRSGYYHSSDEAGIRRLAALVSDDAFRALLPGIRDLSAEWPAVSDDSEAVWIPVDDLFVAFAAVVTYREQWLRELFLERGMQLSIKGADLAETDGPFADANTSRAWTAFSYTAPGGDQYEAGARSFDIGISTLASMAGRADINPLSQPQAAAEHRAFRSGRVLQIYCLAYEQLVIATALDRRLGSVFSDIATADLGPIQSDVEEEEPAAGSGEQVNGGQPGNDQAASSEAADRPVGVEVVVLQSFEVGTDNRTHQWGVQIGFFEDGDPVSATLAEARRLLWPGGYRPQENALRPPPSALPEEPDEGPTLQTGPTRYQLLNLDLRPGMWAYFDPDVHRQIYQMLPRLDPLRPLPGCFRQVAKSWAATHSDGEYVAEFREDDFPCTAPYPAWIVYHRVSGDTHDLQMYAENPTDPDYYIAAGLWEQSARFLARRFEEDNRMLHHLVFEEGRSPKEAFEAIREYHREFTRIMAWALVQIFATTPGSSAVTKAPPPGIARIGARKTPSKAMAELVERYGQAVSACIKPGVPAPEGIDFPDDDLRPDVCRKLKECLFKETPRCDAFASDLKSREE